MKASEALLKGREWLQTHKWGRNYDYNSETGAYCAAGALYAAVTGNEDASLPFNFPNTATVYQAENYLQDAAGTDITNYNDGYAKRKRDVVSVFNKAIQLAKKDGN